MDAFSEILSGVKLNGAVFFTAEFSAPWGFTSPGSRAIAAKVAPGSAHLIPYHLVIEGGAVVELEDGRFITLAPGDVVIFPHGDPHHMSSGRKMRPPFPNYGISAKIEARDLSPLLAGGGGDVSRFVCGYMTCDPYLGRPILEGLPPAFKVNVRTDSSGHWLENSILHLVEESVSGRVGSEAMLTKISEALFVDTLRRYVDGLPEQQRGWLAGARDPVVGRSLGLLHGRIAHPWTIAGLASEVGISRSALVERFTRYLSEPPMTYLTRWRLQLAARSLERTSRGVADIATDIGYESEAAFSRAFKREFGQPPGRYRSDQQERARRRRRRARIASMHVAAATVVALLAFAANSVLCRVALSGGHIDAVSFSVIRFVGGATSLLVIGGWPRRRISQASGWTSAIVLFLYALPFALAYNRLSAGVGALILFGSVQVTMMTAALRGGERPSVWQWLGLGAALGGLVYLVAPGLAGPPLPAAGLMVLAGISWGTYTLRGRASTNPLVDTTRTFVQVVPLVLIAGLLAFRQLHTDGVGIVLAAASGVVASGMGYVVWYSALRGLTATRAAIAQLSVPILAALGGVVFLNERITSRLTVAGAMVLGGVALAVFSRSRGRAT